MSSASAALHCFRKAAIPPSGEMLQTGCLQQQLTHLSMLAAGHLKFSRGTMEHQWPSAKGFQLQTLNSKPPSPRLLCSQHLCRTLAVKRTDLAAAGVPNDDSTCLTTVFLAANMPRPGKQAERTCPANGVQAAWRPDRFLQLSLPPSLGWRQGDPLVLLPEASGYHQAEGTSRGSLSCKLQFECHTQYDFGCWLHGQCHCGWYHPKALPLCGIHTMLWCVIRA